MDSNQNTPGKPEKKAVGKIHIRRITTHLVARGKIHITVLNRCYIEKQMAFSQ